MSKIDNLVESLMRYYASRTNSDWNSYMDKIRSGQYTHEDIRKALDRYIEIRDTIKKSKLGRSLNGME